MKVLFTMDSLKNGGTENSLVHLIRHFSKDIECKVILFYPNRDLEYLYRQYNVDLHFIDLPGKYNFLEGIKSLLDIIRSEKPDIIVSSLYKADIISRLACLLTDIPLVGTLVDDTYSPHRLSALSMFQRWKIFFFWCLNYITAWIPRLWIANAESIANSNAKKLSIPRNRIHTVYRGRDVNNFRQWKPKAPEDSNEAFTFVSYGRLMERKGFKDLISAFNMVYKDFPKARLVIFGEGDYRNELEAYIQKLSLEDVIKLPGQIEFVYNELLNYDCFVFPSWYEGFSGALVEAMMVGIPIIASDISMNLEAVDRRMALIFKVKNVNDLTDKMIYAFEHFQEMEMLCLKAREIAIRRFDIRHISYLYENTLKKAKI